METHIAEAALPLTENNKELKVKKKPISSNGKVLNSKHKKDNGTATKNKSNHVRKSANNMVDSKDAKTANTDKVTKEKQTVRAAEGKLTKPKLGAKSKTKSKEQKYGNNDSKTVPVDYNTKNNNVNTTSKDSNINGNPIFSSLSVNNEIKKSDRKPNVSNYKSFKKPLDNKPSNASSSKSKKVAAANKKDSSKSKTVNKNNNFIKKQRKLENSPKKTTNTISGPMVSRSNRISETPVPVEENFADPYLEKVNKLKSLIDKTTDRNGQMKFDDLTQYLRYFTYNMFLEELFETDICPEIEIKWEDETHCTLHGDMKILFDYYVPPEMVHLKKHPFAEDQPIFLMRKSDMHLEQKPEIWATRVSSRAVLQRGKGGKFKKKFTKNAVIKKDKQKSNIQLEAFSWNESSLPINENGKNFAILPASNVMGRIMNAMNRLKNPFFINLLLGKEKVKKVNFFNKLNYVSDSLNESQKDALQTSLNNRVTILKGPPGSGKTSTIYEIIMQLLDQFHSYPILVVAASNLAVDNIAEKLMKDHKKDLLRITSVVKESEYPMSHHLGDICLHNKVSKNLSDKAKEIQRRMRYDRKSISSSEFSKYMDETMAMGITLVNQARVILSTTVGIGGPYLKNVKEMPVIIMDEATQSSEPASLIPLGAPGTHRIIFVGDEAQLSAFTRVKSLEMSLFERVLRNGSYEKPNMLDTQYRMHPSISEFPRKQFYDGKLKDGVKDSDRELKNIKYPVFFFDHGGVGAHETREFGKTGEEYGFSWGNKKEVTYIERLVENLIVDKGIAREDIGIMTGYSAQRSLITKALERNPIINPSGQQVKLSIDKEDLGKGKNLTTCIVNGIIVSTVDAFQGREKNVVLMSCVRSNAKGEVGFLKDYRRMNVAFTRAKYSFIMIGDASTLQKGDPMWRDYIKDLSQKGFVKTNINEY